jgi:hypothetical protein
MNAGMSFVVAGRMRLAPHLLALVALGAAACGPTYVEVKPSEPLAGNAGRVHADVVRLFLTDEVRSRGLADDIDLVVELRVRNGDARERKVSPGSFSCLMELDTRRPAEMRSLLPGGGGAGPFPGEPPGEGSLLSAVTIAPGQSQVVWAIFHGYRFDGSDRPRRITLRVPLDDGALTLDLADPARGALRWEAPAFRNAIAVGLRDVSVMAGGLHATVPGSEVTFTRRRGPVMWDVGLVSALVVETKGPLQSVASSSTQSVPSSFTRSVTSSFTAVGLTAHLTVPFASWGAPEDPRQLSAFAGGSSSFLVEMFTQSVTDMNGTANANGMNVITPHTYGLFTAEGGLEFSFGAMRFAATPFPLTPDKLPLPSWSFRVGYVQSWSGGATGGGLLTSFRFFF